MTDDPLDQTSDTAPEPRPGELPLADTKERLIQAGILEFAEHGFADAGVRAICARAGANPAAVNYHFGDKQRFYTEVLATCHQRAASHRPIPRLQDDPEHADVVLRRWVRWFLELLLVASENAHLGRLMAREMVNPSPALDEMVRRSLLPIKGVLEEILRAFLPGADERTLRLCFASTISQCLFYKHAQHVFSALERIAAQGNEHEQRLAQMPDRSDLDGLADHISRFALAGLVAVGSDAVGTDAVGTDAVGTDGDQEHHR